MLEKDTIIKVRNRDNGSVGYTIPDLGNLKREFASGEIKDVTMEELRKLSYIPGGQYILENCLVIENQEAIQELLGDVEPEYAFTSEDVKNLLINGSLDQLLDALDFAPKGVVELIKSYAVELEINDIQKRKAILEKTGFNVDKAIEINHIDREDAPSAEEKKVRRAASTVATTTSTTNARRSNYKVVK